MEINIAAISAIISAIISFGTMCCTIYNAKINKKDIVLQIKKYEESKPNFKVNTLRSEAKKYISQDKVVLRFLVLFTNLSNKGTSLKSIRLRVVGEENNLILLPIVNDQLISSGENLGANHSNKGWIEFELNVNDYKNLKIIKYELEITDIYDNIEKDITINMREEVIKDEK